MNLCDVVSQQCISLRVLQYVFSARHEIFVLFYVKKEVSGETSFIFIFYCGTVSRETGEKMADWFLIFVAQK